MKQKTDSELLQMILQLSVERDNIHENVTRLMKKLLPKGRTIKVQYNAGCEPGTTKVIQVDRINPFNIHVVGRFPNIKAQDQIHYSEIVELGEKL